MRRGRRSAFRQVRARRRESGIKGDEQENKGEPSARSRDATNPEGETPPSRQRNPVGVLGHVLRGERSVRILQEKTIDFLWPRHRFDIFYPPDPPYNGQDQDIDE